MCIWIRKPILKIIASSVFWPIGGKKKKKVKIKQPSSIIASKMDIWMQWKIQGTLPPLFLYPFLLHFHTLHPGKQIVEFTLSSLWIPRLVHCKLKTE